MRRKTRDNLYEPSQARLDVELYYCTFSKLERLSSTLCWFARSNKTIESYLITTTLTWLTVGPLSTKYNGYFPTRERWCSSRGWKRVILSPQLNKVLRVTSAGTTVSCMKNKQSKFYFLPESAKKDREKLPLLFLERYFWAWGNRANTL